MLLTALAAPVIGVTVPAAHAQSAYQVFLGQGTAHTVKLPAGQAATVTTARDVGDIRVGDPEVAQVAPLGPDSLYLLGIGPGRTTVTVYDEDKASIGVLQVEVGVDVSDLSRAVRDHVPEAQLHVSTVNGRLRLAGDVPNGQALATVLDLARQYVGENEFINAIRVAESQQVLLEVRFIEANRRAGKELGVDVAIRSDDDFNGLRTGAVGLQEVETADGGTVLTPGISIPNTGQGEDAFRFPLTNNLPFGTLITQIVTNGVKIDSFIRALERNGLGRSLAEPNLTALSGSTASFLAGGEFPIPTRDALGNVEVEFKEFGVRLTFTPLVLEDGLINLNLKPEVSQLDRSISIEGVPGLITRKTETTVELRDGQSFAISGLLQANTEKQIEQLPWLGDVPIVGTLFSSKSFIKQETDLVVIVTPRLVRPTAPGEPLRTPLDGSRNSTDVEFFFAGLLEIDDAVLRDIQNGMGIEGPTGHILDLPNAYAEAVHK